MGWDEVDGEGKGIEGGGSEIGVGKRWGDE